MDKDTFTLIIGILGATIILVAFLMNQLNKWSNNSLNYDLINFIGSVFLIIYAILLGSIPFIVLNCVWAAFSFKDVWKRVMKRVKFRI